MLSTANAIADRRPARAGAPRLDATGDQPAHEPFSPQTIAALFRPWETARKIVVAVSGGPDSVALMLLAAEWASTQPGAPELHIATVDHGLRQEARAEAEKVGAWAHQLGLEHDILVWAGGKPKSRIQERARDARYDLLFAHAARVGADVVATGHHADDQAETILFRLLRGSGLGGLSGMAQSFERLGLTHARPLLACSKAELIRFCRSRRQPFVADPSNSDPVYARTRMRALCGLLEDAGLGRAALLRLGRRAGRAEAALAARAAAVAASLVAAREPGRFCADLSSLAQEPEEIFLRVLGREIALLGDPSRRLRLERLETLALAMREALLAGAPHSATLGGTTLKLGRDNILTIRAERKRRSAEEGRATAAPEQ